MLLQKRPGVQLKSKAELDGMRRAGRLASECLQWLCEQVEPGMPTEVLHTLQMEFAKKHGATPAPLNYKGFPKSMCTSINHVICHGIPSPTEILREGDIVGIDVTLILDGFYGDNAATIGVGTISPDAQKLLEVTLESLRLAVDLVKPGKRLGDLGHAIQSFAEKRHGYGVVRDFVGHGIGTHFHEEPQIPHVGKPRQGFRLRPGMTFTIEPMVNIGDWGTTVLADGWTAVSTDGSLSAQFEHTMAVTQDGVELLTVQNGAGTWENPGRVKLQGLT